MRSKLCSPDSTSWAGGGEPKRRPTVLDWIRRDSKIRKFVALTFKAECLSSPREPQYLQSLFGERHPPAYWDIETLELMGCVTHACPEFHSPVGNVVKNREILGETNGVSKRQKADVG